LKGTARDVGATGINSAYAALAAPGLSTAACPHGRTAAKTIRGRSQLHGVFDCLCAAGLAPWRRRKDLPDRPVLRDLVPPGGATDTYFRQLTVDWAELGQPVVIETRGGGGYIGWQRSPTLRRTATP
jgi:hypothetical protein